MAKYTAEVKAQAVAAAKDGMSLKLIQTNIGPNPKATMRYLKKEGIDYADLKKELVEAGKLQAPTHDNKTVRNKKAKAKKAAEIVQAEEVIVE